jgi:hypothetical protein
MSLMDMAERALALVLLDLQDLPDEIDGFVIEDHDDFVRLTHRGAVHAGSLGMSEHPEAVLAAVADDVQGYVTYGMGDPVWPTCPLHDFGLHPEVADGRAVWVCRPHRHAVARIGELHTT